MNHSTYRFSLDIQSTQSQVSVPVMLGDTGRVWRISLTNGGSPFPIDDGCLAMVSIKRPTGTYLEAFCVIENNTTIKYEFALNEATAIVEGIHDCQVTLFDAEGQKITSPRFSMVVSERVVNRDDINISDDDRTTVDNMIAREAERSAAETARVNAEAARVNAEAERNEAEAARKSAFEEAKDTLDSMVANGDFDGKDGTSVTHAWNGTVLTITSASGTTSQDLKGDEGKQGKPGERGPAGQGFSISKTYPSIAQMNAGFSSDSVPLNGFVLINTGNTEDEDNAKLFVKTESGYSYLTDLSGAQGIKGEQGDPYELTDDDKEEIVASVLEKIPTGGGGSANIPFYDLATLGLPTVKLGGTTADLEIDTADIRAALDNGPVKFAVNVEGYGRVDLVMNKYTIVEYGLYMCVYYDGNNVSTLMIAENAVQASIVPLRMLPEVGDADDGKVLTVKNGEWSAETPRGGSGVEREIPAYDLAALGLPTVKTDGTTSDLTLDTTDICAALDKGAVKFGLNVDGSGAVEVVMTKYEVNGMYLCTYTIFNLTLTLMIATNGIQASATAVSSAATYNGEVEVV